MLVLYCEEKWLKCTSRRCARLIFSRSWCLFKRDIGDILSLKRWLAEEVFWSEVLFFFSRPACSWYVYLLDTRFLSFGVLALFSSFLVGLASADTCICLSEGARWICLFLLFGLLLSPFLSSSFFLWCGGWYSVSSCLNVLEGESCEKYPDSPSLVRGNFCATGRD